MVNPRTYLATNLPVLCDRRQPARAAVLQDDRGPCTARQAARQAAGGAVERRERPREDRGPECLRRRLPRHSEGLELQRCVAVRLLQPGGRRLHGGVPRPDQRGARRRPSPAEAQRPPRPQEDRRARVRPHRTAPAPHRQTCSTRHRRRSPLLSRALGSFWRCYFGHLLAVLRGTELEQTEPAAERNFSSGAEVGSELSTPNPKVRVG